MSIILISPLIRIHWEIHGCKDFETRRTITTIMMVANGVGIFFGVLAIVMRIINRRRAWTMAEAFTVHLAGFHICK
jgi:hypothetical protein